MNQQKQNSTHQIDKMAFKSPFTATKLQVITYLLGVALFSISFLVFLNSSVSFVITDLIGQKHALGDAVGTLGFADEIVALVACPVWGLLSDRLGVRYVSVVGYAIVGVSLFAFVQARNVYPQLLLARLLFSVGGAAITTMVTAILPSMTALRHSIARRPSSRHEEFIDDDGPPGSRSSVITVTPARYRSVSQGNSANGGSARSATSQTAGIVGMFTGIGALVALTLFLPLRNRFTDHGATPKDAVSRSFYTVGGIALAVSVFCFVGLRKIAGEEHKGFNVLLGRHQHVSTTKDAHENLSYLSLLTQAVALGFRDMAIGLGYIGGFVARASSVAISLFIPLYVNAYFVSSGLCNENPNTPPSEIKNACSRAYTLAAILSGVSQLIALLCAPLFGYLGGRFRRYNTPLLVASIAGIAGYISLAQVRNPEISKARGGSPTIFLIMALLGISQIGAIVCSLSLLGSGIQDTDEMPLKRPGEHDVEDQDRPQDSTSPLLGPRSDVAPQRVSRSHLKGSIAGVYSLGGGAGILLLTKLGGFLFDRLSPGAPFYIMAIFNGVLLVVGLACSIGNGVQNVRLKRSHD